MSSRDGSTAHYGLELGLTCWHIQWVLEYEGVTVSAKASKRQTFLLLMWQVASAQRKWHSTLGAS